MASRCRLLKSHKLAAKFKADDFLGAKYHNPGNPILQLANVPRPLPPLERLQRVQTQMWNRSAKLTGKSFKQVLAKLRNILLTFAKWQQMHAMETEQSQQSIVASAALQPRLQVNTRGAHKPGICRQVLISHPDGDIFRIRVSASAFCRRSESASPISSRKSVPPHARPTEPIAVGLTSLAPRCSIPEHLRSKKVRRNRGTVELQKGSNAARSNPYAKTGRSLPCPYRSRLRSARGRSSQNARSISSRTLRIPAVLPKINSAVGSSRRTSWEAITVIRDPEC